MIDLPPGQLRQQVDLFWELLGKIDLASDRVYSPAYARLDVSIVRELPYRQQWEHFVKNQFYDFSLVDGALIQIVAADEPSSNCFSLCYCECPRRTLSYAECLKRQGFAFNEVGESLRVEYETDSMNYQEKECVTPSRYDYAPDQYAEGRHPASHLHFGHDSEIRVATRRIMKPLSFFCFVVRQYYPEHWQKLLGLRLPKQCLRNIREDLDEVPRDYVKPLDSHELRLE